MSSSIDQKVAQIRTAVYGEEVRESIASAIEEIDSVAEGARDSATASAEAAAESESASQASKEAAARSAEGAAQSKASAEAAAARAEAAASGSGARYGVSGIGQSAAALTRLYDAEGMVAQVGTDGDNSAVRNDFDSAAPFMRRKCVGKLHKENDRAVFRVAAYEGDEDYAEDGSMGDYVAVECPKAYYKITDSELTISAARLEGFRPFDIFCRKHNPQDVMEVAYIPAYSLALDEDGHAVSLPGFDNEQGNYKQLVDAARTYSGDAKEFAILQPAAVNFYEWALFTVEFATQDAQTVMMGCSNLRSSNDDKGHFIDATHFLIGNYQAARVPGQRVAIIGASEDQYTASRKATHKILSLTRCDANGVANASGAYQLAEVEDLGRGYYEYDTTTEYRFVGRPYQTGATRGVSTSSGSPVSNTNGYYPMKYRHRENTYANQYKTLMDLFSKRVGTGDADYYLEHYYLPDPAAYTPSTASKPDAADLATDAFVKLDIEALHENYVNGYVKSVKRSEVYPDLWVPYQTTGASATTFFADYAYLVYSSPVRTVRLGGFWNFGRYAGFSSFSGFIAPSTGLAYSGGDLFFTQ